MSPILVRPVREQLEHDRVIRLLQAKYRRKHEVAINVGLEQTTPVQVGTGQLFPDLVLFSTEKSRKLQGTIEVETGESVNSLETMAQWVPFSRLKAPFILYVPPVALDAARRLCAAHGAEPAEIWTYHVNFDQVRFTLAHRSANAPAMAPEPRKSAEGGKPAGKAAAKPAKAAPKPASKPASKPAPKAKAPAAKAKPVAKAKPAARPKPTPAARTAPKPAARKAAPKKPAAKAKPAKHR
ncbi:MAG: hypothetical protein Q8L86_03220 [Vicinamibacterales bacterium]|nr:hypothetical protein [Vicinamibacterales bacterium]